MKWFWVRGFGAKLWVKKKDRQQISLVYLYEPFSLIVFQNIIYVNYFQHAYIILDNNLISLITRIAQWLWAKWKLFNIQYRRVADFFIFSVGESNDSFLFLDIFWNTIDYLFQTTWNKSSSSKIVDLDNLIKLHSFDTKNCWKIYFAFFFNLKLIPKSFALQLERNESRFRFYNHNPHFLQARTYFYYQNSWSRQHKCWYNS